jgi:hypothetical protein
MGYEIQQSQAAVPLVFLLISSTDSKTGLTGKAGSVVVALSKNGGAFAVPIGAIAEIGNGWYSVAGNATDSNTLGPLALHAKDAASDPIDDRFDVVAYNPFSLSLGLSLAKGTNITGFNDIAATAIVSGGAITTSGGKVSGVATCDVVTTVNDARMANLDAAVSTRSTLVGPAGFSSLVIAGGGVSLNMAQSVPLGNNTTVTAPTVGNALNAAHSAAAGAETKPNTPGTTTYTISNADGTVFRAFTLDSGTSPTSRS